MPFVKKGMEILSYSSSNLNSSSEKFANFKTKSNIVRCIERLHPSAPRPFYDHALTRGWSNTPTWNCFAAAAVRGFHKPSPCPGFYPPMVYHAAANDSHAPYQEEVSDCLIAVVEHCNSLLENNTELNHEIEFLRLNSSFALIRWLHKKHIARVKTLLQSKHCDPLSRGNLFHALYRFRKPDIFADCTELFAGMEVSWVCLSQSLISEKFIFKKVIFGRFPESKLDGFSQSTFESCEYLEEKS